MARPIVTPFQVADVNDELKAAGIDARVHLSDACGVQSLRIELGPRIGPDRAREAVEGAFRARGMRAEFDAAGETFRLA